MRCVDCVSEKKVNSFLPIQEATQLLIMENPDRILPLCERHIHEYVHNEGEMNLDFYFAQITGVGCVAFVERLNEIFAYHDKKYTYLLDEYNKIKKEMKP